MHYLWGEHTLWDHGLEIDWSTVLAPVAHDERRQGKEWEGIVPVTAFVIPTQSGRLVHAVTRV